MRIRFGLGAVRGVGGAALDAILAARETGPFRDLFDFTGRVDPRPVNRGVVEALVKAGAFDVVGKRVGVGRAAMFASIDRALEFGRSRQRDRDVGQQGLFDTFLASGAAASAPVPESLNEAAYTAAEEWDETVLLRFERESVGAYLSGHPLHRFGEDLKRYADTIAADVEEQPVGSTVTVGGMVESFVERLNKKTGRRTAVFQLEDLTGAVETFVPPQALEKLEAVLRAGRPILCTGRVETSSFRDPSRGGGGDEGDDEAVRFVLTEAATFEAVRLERARSVHVRLESSQADDGAFDRLRRLLDESRGNCAVFVHLRVPNRGETILQLPDRWRVSPTDALLLGIQREFGAGSAAVQ